MSLFNSEQRAYMEYLHRTPPEERCWCGWYLKGECYNCTRDTRIAYKTCADKMAMRCEECGSTPNLPEQPVYYYGNCSRRQRADERRRAT